MAAFGGGREVVTQNTTEITQCELRVLQVITVRQNISHRLGTIQRQRYDRYQSVLPSSELEREPSGKAKGSHTPPTQVFEHAIYCWFDKIFQESPIKPGKPVILRSHKKRSTFLNKKILAFFFIYYR